MNIDYKLIGKRIAHRRKSLGLKQSEVEERAEIGYKYLSSIERGLSIPSIEVVMRLAAALDTTPDTFLVGSARQETARWESVAQYLRLLDEKQLDTAESFLPGLWEKACPLIKQTQRPGRTPRARFFYAAKRHHR